MRNRLLRHEYFDGARYAFLSPQELNVFLALLCYADRAGRLVFNRYKLRNYLKRIKQSIEAIEKLVSVDMLIRYSVDSVDYLQFAEHVWEDQRIFGKENPSKLPGPLATETVKAPKDKIPVPKWKIKKASRDQSELDFRTFLASYPKEKNNAMEVSRSRKYWRALQASKKLPVLEALIASARQIDIDKLPNPSTFLKNQMWSESCVSNCSYCDNDRVVYGVKPDGSKGMVPCPKCQLTRMMPM